MKMIISLLALAICYGILAGYLYVTYDQLPDRLATHFDGAGQPNGWMPRAGYVVFLLIFGIAMPLFMIGTTALTNKLPARFVNVPNRQYWLAPERRALTTAYLQQFVIWVACLLELFFCGVHWMVMRANATGGAPHMSGNDIMIVVGGFISGLTIAIGVLVLRFAKKS
jgi:serine/threonine-protein kinase